mgnify:CR=1 FL=1
MSCGEAGKIEKLKKELKEKKQELASVNKEILDLQTEIDLLDTTAKENTIPVKVDTLGHSKFSNMVTLQGLVKSDKNIRMSSEVPGRIEKIYVREGQKVSFGQALVKMNSEMISSQINELKSDPDYTTDTIEVLTKKIEETKEQLKECNINNPQNCDEGKLQQLSTLEKQVDIKREIMNYQNKKEFNIN